MKTFNEFINYSSVNERKEKGERWTIEEIGKIANNYKDYKDFKKNQNYLWIVATKNGWIKWLFPEYKPSKPKGYWDNKENVRKEAKKYSGPKEFYDNNRGAHKAALKHGWMYEFYPFKRNTGGKRLWFFKDVENIASEYDTLSDFRENEPNAYGAAIQYKWIDKLFNYYNNKRTFKIKNYWNNKENVRKEASKYKIRSEMHQKNPSAYSSMITNGWIDEFFPEKNVYLNKKWSEENVRKEASKYKYRGEFSTKSQSAYKSALNYEGLLDELFPLKNNIWTEENLRKEASKYKSRGEFSKNSQSAYRKSKKIGLLDEFFPNK